MIRPTLGGRRIVTRCLIHAIWTLIGGTPALAAGPGSPKIGDIAGPKATVAEPAGPIPVETTVDDADLAKALREVLPRYPGVRRVGVEVEHGVVGLSGHVEDAGVRERVRDLARKVEGVRLVVDDLKTDAQVRPAGEVAVRRLARYEMLVASQWPPALLACGIVATAIGSARLFSRHADVLVGPFVADAHRAAVSSVVGLAMVGGGLLAALSLLGLSESVLSVLGVVGAMGGAKAHLSRRGTGVAGEAEGERPASGRPAPSPMGRFRRVPRPGRIAVGRPSAPRVRP